MTASEVVPTPHNKPQYSSIVPIKLNKISPFSPPPTHVPITVSTHFKYVLEMSEDKIYTTVTVTTICLRQNN